MKKRGGLDGINVLWHLEIPRASNNTTDIPEQNKSPVEFRMTKQQTILSPDLTNLNNLTSLMVGPSLSRGWSGGAMVLGKLLAPGRPTTLDTSRARAYCAYSRWGLFGRFSLVYHFSFLSPSLWETARYRLKYCLKGRLSPKQPKPSLSLMHDQPARK